MRHWAVAFILILSSLCPRGINTLTDRNLQLEKSGSDLVALAGSSAGLSLDPVLLTSFSSDTYPSIMNPFAFASSAVSGTVTFSCTNLAIGLLKSSARCGDGNLETRIVISDNDGVDDSACIRLSKALAYAGRSYQFRAEFDTGKYYIEHCYDQPNVWKDFGFVSSSGEGLEVQGDTIWAGAREWLISVLYLNPDSTYYCGDLAEYANTFAHKDELGNYPAFRTLIAIMKYIQDSSRCKHLAGGPLSGYWSSCHRFWQDTVTDSIATPFDTTLPTLDEIGQQFLRGFAAGVADGTEGATKALRSLRADRNPFGGDADLTYITSLPSVTKIEVYDALGRQLWTNGQGYVDPGEHHLRIPTASWSAGAYYARLSTIRGEVLTTKLVFEK